MTDLGKCYYSRYLDNHRALRDQVGPPLREIKVHTLRETLREIKVPPFLRVSPPTQRCPIPPHDTKKRFRSKRIDHTP